jgi:hypothetical protein
VWRLLVVRLWPIDAKRSARPNDATAVSSATAGRSADDANAIDEWGVEVCADESSDAVGGQQADGIDAVTRPAAAAVDQYSAGNGHAAGASSGNVDAGHAAASGSSRRRFVRRAVEANRNRK